VVGMCLTSRGTRKCGNPIEMDEYCRASIHQASTCDFSIGPSIPDGCPGVLAAARFKRAVRGIMRVGMGEMKWGRKGFTSLKPSIPFGLRHLHRSHAQ
jgi:hypothetical protein